MEFLNTARNPRAKLKLDDGEVLINPLQMKDVWDLYHRESAFRISSNATKSMFLCRPPEVTIPQWGSFLTKELKDIMANYWMSTMHECYDYMKMFGVVPYFFERIEGTDHVRPVVPAWGSGYITTLQVRRGIQGFRWYWRGSNAGSHDTKMHWWFAETCPTLDGNLRSDVSSLLPLYRLGLTLMDSLQTASYDAARPYFIYEHRPTDSNMDSYTNMGNYGAEMAGDLTIMQDQVAVEELRRRPLKIRTRDLQNQLMETAYVQEGYQRSRGVTGYTEPSSSFYDRTSMKPLSRAVPIPAEFHYVSPQMPQVVGRVEEVWKKVSSDAANVCDFPLSFSQPQGAQRSANVEGQSRYINERIKSLLQTFRQLFRKVFMESYGKLFLIRKELLTRLPSEVLVPGIGSVPKESLQSKPGKEKRKAKREPAKSRSAKRKRRVVPIGDPDDEDPSTTRLMGKFDQRERTVKDEQTNRPLKTQKIDSKYRRASLQRPSDRQRRAIWREVDVEINMYCTPMMAYNSLRNLKIDNVIDMETFARHALHMFGLSPSDEDLPTSGLFLEEREFELKQKQAMMQIEQMKMQTKMQKKSIESGVFPGLKTLGTQKDHQSEPVTEKNRKDASSGAVPGNRKKKAPTVG